MNKDVIKSEIQWAEDQIDEIKDVISDIKDQLEDELSDEEYEDKCEILQKLIDELENNLFSLNEAEEFLSKSKKIAKSL